RPEALQIEELVERFAREARAAAKIRSEHVARVFDVGTLPDGVPFIVMEHLAGQDLADVLAERGPLPIKVAIEYVMQACEALAAAHAAGVIHRDIKPENLFLTRHAQGLDFIKILDFGISKVALSPGGKRAFVRTAMPIGSPVYMSPEQIRSSEHVDPRTDIWSLGCVLFELLTGVVAFDEPTLMQLSAAILEQDPVPLRALVPDAPQELEEVVLRCLEKDADKRYSNIAELAIALYPFAPRRSRISAERCYHALRNAGIECPAFDLQSEYPPSMGEMPVLSSAAPGRVTTPGRVSAGAQSSTRMSAAGRVSAAARVSAPVQITPVPAPAIVSEPLPLANASSGALTREELESLRPNKKYKVLGLLALVAAVAAGTFLAVRHSESFGAGQNAQTAHDTPPTATTFGASLPKAEPKIGSVAAPIDLDNLPAERGARGVDQTGAAASARAQHPVATGVPHRAVAPLGMKGPPSAGSGRKRAGDDEPDVGY
ncbi:MAG: protein kinase, partial [Pseudomonadota bacterium]